MRKARKPLHVEQLGPAKVASAFPHLQAVIESGDQFTVDGSARGLVTAFSAKQLLMAMRRDPGEVLWPQLRRMDLAVALAQATGKCIDEVCGDGVVPAAPANEAVGLPSRRFAQIQALLAWGGTICFGYHPCAAGASQNHTPWVVLAPRPAESIEDLLRRLDWAIATAHSTRRCIDEVSCP